MKGQLFERSSGGVTCLNEKLTNFFEILKEISFYRKGVSVNLFTLVYIHVLINFFKKF